MTRTCTIKVIRFQFRQLLTNLINNSLKFSSTEKIPHIDIKCEMQEGKKLRHYKLLDGNYCHISVADNGVGFDQQYSDKIFDLFLRLHSTADYQETGVGLAIVKKIVENHKGIILAEGKANKGATFNIYIPAN